MANEKDNKNVDTQGQQVNPATNGEPTAQNVQPPVNPQPVAQNVTEQQKPGVKDKIKKNWKGIVGTVVAVGVAAAATIKAYSLGTQKGMNMKPPMPGGYDPNSEYALNPNVDE